MKFPYFYYGNLKNNHKFIVTKLWVDYHCHNDTVMVVLNREVEVSLPMLVNETLLNDKDKLNKLIEAARNKELHVIN